MIFQQIRINKESKIRNKYKNIIKKKNKFRFKQDKQNKKIIKYNHKNYNQTTFKNKCKKI